MGAAGLAIVATLGAANMSPALAVAGGLFSITMIHGWMALRRPTTSLESAVLVDTTVIGVAAALAGIPPLGILVPVAYLVLATAVWVARAYVPWIGLYVLSVGIGAPLVRYLTDRPVWQPGTEAIAEILGVLSALPLLVLLASRVHSAIEERVLAEERLEAHNRLNAALIEGSPYGIAVADPNEIVISANPVFRLMFGGAPAGLRITELFDENDLDRAEEGTMTVVRAHTPDGRSFPVELAWSSIPAEPFGRVYFARDVSPREKRTERLRFQAAVLEQAQNAIVATDLAGVITYWSRGAEELLGWDAEETVGRPIGDVLVVDRDPSDIVEHEEELRSGGRWTGEAEVRSRAGSMIPVLMTTSALTDASGAVVGWLRVAADMSRQRATEQEAFAAQRLAARALERVSVPVAVMDTLGQSVAANRAWRALAGSDEIGADILPGMDPAFQHAVALAIAEVASEFVDRREVEAVPVTVLDEQRWYRVEASAVATNVMVTMVDVTASVLEQRSMQAAVDSQSQLIAEVSHEIKGPLGNLLGLAQTLSSGLIPTSEPGVLYDMIADQAGELAYLFDDLLVAARARGGQLELKQDLVDVGSEIRVTVRAATPQRPVDLGLPSDLPLVVGDRIRVRQIIRNLLTNAFRYGGDRVEISADRASSDLRVTVRDNGDGVDSVDAETVFEPYGRAAQGRAHDLSTGLGLHVARELARRMGGDLRYRRQGSWTAFELTLPVADAGSEITAAEEDQRAR
jgi:PAS domain S-box-containing protein